MPDIPKTQTMTQKTALDVGKKLLQAAFLILCLLLTALALWPAAWIYFRFAPPIESPLAWVGLVMLCLLVFSYTYLILLLVLRILIPKPAEGFYPQREDGRPPKEVALLMVNILLMRLRYGTPWSATILSTLGAIPPLGGLFRRIFGPHTPSQTFGDSLIAIDPHLLYAGKNVQFGFRAFMTGHVFDNRGMLIKRVVIEDYALIGGFAKLLPGVHVGHHAVVAFASVVKPNTKIGPYELWAGNPARKIRDLPRDDSPAAEAARKALAREPGPDGS